jgi:hypothetical protein
MIEQITNFFMAALIVVAAFVAGLFYTSITVVTEMWFNSLALQYSIINENIKHFDNYFFNGFWVIVKAAIAIQIVKRLIKILVDNFFNEKNKLNTYE